MRRLTDRLADLGLRPAGGNDLPSLFAWLGSQDMTGTSRVLDAKPEDLLPGGQYLDGGYAIAQATARYQSRPLKQDELKKLKEDWKNKSPDVNADALWAAMKDAEASVRRLDWQKLPAEAMAFYRPFHYEPFGQWGIYLLIGPLLHYHRALSAKGMHWIDSASLMHLVLFEIFNHEFFHHLVESTATTLEVLLATQGKAQPVYLRYREQQARNVFNHPHAPLEEALANAYAYNALSFISRVKAGFKTGAIKTYQKAVIQHWHREPPGYRDAGLYIGGDYAAGGAHLLAQMLNDPEMVHQIPLELIARQVMPSGFTSLQAKPDIPTWLVGSEEELALFNTLVPAPNEAYTQLFWPYETSKVDTEIQRRMDEEKTQKARAKAGASAASALQGGLF